MLSLPRGRPPKKLPGDYLRNEQVNAAWHGSSDRAAVLVLSAQLETLVDAAVRKSLTGRHRQGRHPLLDGPTAPVGTWFSKNLLLRESGIISERLWRDIAGRTSRVYRLVPLRTRQICGRFRCSESQVLSRCR